MAEYISDNDKEVIAAQIKVVASLDKIQLIEPDLVHEDLIVRRRAVEPPKGRIKRLLALLRRTEYRYVSVSAVPIPVKGEKWYLVFEEVGVDAKFATPLWQDEHGNVFIEQDLSIFFRHDILHGYYTPAETARENIAELQQALSQLYHPSSRRRAQPLQKVATIE